MKGVLSTYLCILMSNLYGGGGGAREEHGIHVMSIHQNRQINRHLNLHRVPFYFRVKPI